MCHLCTYSDSSVDENLNTRKYNMWYIMCYKLNGIWHHPEFQINALSLSKDVKKTEICMDINR